MKGSYVNSNCHQLMCEGSDWSKNMAANGGTESECSNFQSPAMQRNIWIPSQNVTVGATE